MADFPLLKMINIDGRQTPFAYPQHGTLLRGYVETGEENPLPTKDELVNKTLTELKETLESQELKVKNVKITNQPTDYPDSAVKTELEAINIKLDGKTEIINLPETQDVKVTNQPKDYPDKSVKTELELIKQENVAIKESQAEIIEALKVSNENLQSTNEVLNSVIKDDRLQSDTQVIGSKVEEGILTRPNKDFIEVSLTGETLESKKDQIFDVYANEGEIWTLTRFGYQSSRETSAEGFQLIWIYHGAGNSSDRFMMTIQSDAKQYLRGTIPGRRESAYSGNITPENPFEMIETLRGTTVLSDRLPIRIRYRNTSDKPIGAVNFKLFFLVEKVGDRIE